MTARCVLVIPDAGPLNSLWTAGRLDLLTALDLPIIVIDEIYAEVTADPAHYAKDRDVKAFLDGLVGHGLTIAETFVGQQAKLARAQGGFKTGRGLGDAAIAEFMSDGLQNFAAQDAPVLLLFEDADFRTIRFVRKPDHLHLLSTVAMLRAMERLGIVASADAIIAAMTNPDDPTKRGRMFQDLPDGYEDAALAGNTWAPALQR